MIEPSFLRATRTAYDARAAEYAAFVSGSLETRPLDRAMFAVFAELVRAAGAGPVADLGCGPGHVTAHLHSLGLEAFGVDLSPQMIELARRAHPHLRFEEGAMTALDLPDGALGGIVAWYSLIHTPPERVPEVLAGFHRLLAPGGRLLIAFQSGDERLTAPEPFDHKVTLAYRWPLGRVAELLRRAGFAVDAELRCDQDDRFPQGCLLVRKPAGAGGR
ncbi:class I SAM-dependent DNA methyltransferase [Planomonospora venezuelensis]|uniref:SAM-dependent methyltransferase n=1 Tax=Planomonospora venezuelensis TaxID=1999 RepID=A0A841DE76_PLAVE|nr:class I SAM-dependent methyltransferase [Planomonospora venezuelensis]MBB5967769.1 SAM-dependent methyltransferase [Planomonospora venezuelensis]GIM62296.1 methyltransferase [Planomonospora venezuelensis]